MAKAAAKKLETTDAHVVQRPVKAARKRSFEPMEQKVGQDNPRDLPTEGPAEIEPALIEPVYGPDWKSKADLLQFMEEPVEVMVHETTDKNAELIVQSWNGGRSQFFIRGQPQICKRKFVEVLARSKITAYRQEHYKDDNGADAIRNIPMTALRYPFSVIRDNNPRGADWLRAILSEA